MRVPKSGPAVDVREKVGDAVELGVILGEEESVAERAPVRVGF